MRATPCPQAGGSFSPPRRPIWPRIRPPLSGSRPAAVHGTVLNHHGAITAQSQEGQGSTFMIFLPLSGEVAAAPAEATAALPVRGQARVLLADDEAVIR